MGLWAATVRIVVGWRLVLGGEDRSLDLGRRRALEDEFEEVYGVLIALIPIGRRCT